MSNRSETPAISVDEATPRPQKRSWADMDKPKSIFERYPGVPSDTARLHWLLDSGEFSDLKIQCRDEIFDVHKAVVLVQSTVFHEEVARTNADFLILDEELTIVQDMIAFLYDYENRDWSVGVILDLVDNDGVTVNHVPKLIFPGDDPIVSHLGLYGCATRYGIPGLRKRQLERMAVGIAREVMDYDLLEELVQDKAFRQEAEDVEDKRWGRVLKSVREFRH